MLKAVAFDLWETLITDPPEIGQKQEATRVNGFAAAFSRIARPVDPDEVARAHKETWHRCWEGYWSRDLDLSARGQVSCFLEILGADPNAFQEEEIAEFEAIYGGAALDHPPALVPGAGAILACIRGMGLAVGVISNTGRTPGRFLREILHLNGLAPMIDAMVFSNEHGECKPNRSIFERLRDELGCEFAEMMFVGDSLYADVWGAQQCGMTAVHFAPATRGSAVGHPTRDGWDLAPHPTVTALGELTSLVKLARDGRLRRPFDPSVELAT